MYKHFFSKVTDPNNCWYKVNEALLDKEDNFGCLTKWGFQNQRETRWWDDTEAKAITQKRKLWKEWQKYGNKEEYI